MSQLTVLPAIYAFNTCGRWPLWMPSPHCLIPLPYSAGDRGRAELTSPGN